MKIACFQVEPWQEPVLKEKLKDHELIIFQEPLSKENIEKAKEAEIISVRAKGLDGSLDEEMLSQFSNLRFIAARSTGFDYIDLKYCASRKISVSCVPSYGESSVAEHVFALILAISRRLPFANRNKENLKEIRGFDLSGKIMGIIGSGKIGLKVIALAKAFGMNVVAYDIFKNQEASERLDFKYVDLAELLSKSDVVSLHAPLTPQTHHIINEKNIELVKEGAILINTARGGLVDNRVLLKALDNNRLASAGLDVIDGENENLPVANQTSEVRAIMKHEKVVHTFHEAGNSKEARELAIYLTIKNINRFVDGNPINVVGPS